MAVRCLSVHDDFANRRIMDVLGAIFEALMFLLGIYQEHVMTNNSANARGGGEVMLFIYSYRPGMN